MAHNAIEEFYKKELPFLDVRSVPVNYVDDIGVADPEDFNAALERFIKESESRKMNEKEKLLGNLIEEYKSERRRGIE
jgi:predicted RNase H-like nuclease (RuvC/YqgF family)